MVTWVTALGARRSVRRATPVDDQASAFDAGAVAGAARVAEPQLVGRAGAGRSCASSQRAQCAQAAEMTITVGAFYLARQVLLPWTGL